MTDVHNTEQRSRNMAAIKASNTSPEIYVRKILFAEGFRYRLHKKYLPGKPDIVLAKYKTVVFIHGCFWHKHLCHLGTTPKSNSEFWNKKLTSNSDRDLRNIKLLLDSGWKVVIVWECAVKGKLKLPEQILKLSLSAKIRGKSSELIEILGDNK